MKNLVFGLIATVIFSVSGFANTVISKKADIVAVNELSKEVRIEYSYGNKKITIAKSFNSNEAEMQKFIDAELDKMAIKLSSLDNAVELACSATVHVGTANNYIEVTVSGPCSEIAAAVKKLKKELMAAL
jgi:biopolymer transport protein ExbB/TolQ